MTAAIDTPYLSIEGELALEALMDEPRWVMWRFEKKPNGDIDKPPYPPGITNRCASNKKPSDWSTYDQARTLASANGMSGVGFMLTDHPELRALDLDNCRDPETGQASEWATDLINQARSYTEVTPSGTGFRIIGIGKERSGSNRKINAPGADDFTTPDGELVKPSCEVYIGRPRYITVTFQHLAETPETLESIDDAIDSVLSWSPGPIETNPKSGSSCATFRAKGPLAETALPSELQALIREPADPDANRSDQFHHAVCWLGDYGWPEADIVSLLEKYPDGVVAKYVEEKKDIADQVRRSLSKRKPKPEAANVQPGGLSEDDLALELAKRYGDRLRFDHSSGRWHEWQGTHWQRDELKATTEKARGICRDASSNLKPAIAEKLLKRNTISAIELLARADARLAVTSERWDSDLFLLGTAAGVVDLKTGHVRRAQPDDYITKLAGTSPAARPDCPLWLRFLEDATRGDADLIRFIQRMCGYALTGDTREHALFFVYGPGGNGKSVFLNTLAGILGDYAATAAMDTFTASYGDRHSTELAMLHGARLVSASETEEGRAWAESRIKQLTGGDLISARFMRQDFFEFKPQFKLVVVGNHQPELHNVDAAARRRFRIIPFIHKPVRPDRELEDKLKIEWPGILRWMIEGCLEWQRNGLTNPDTVAAATETYFEDQDIFAQWLEDSCHVEADNGHIRELTANLFKSWTDFAIANGEAAGTKKKFAARLNKHGLQQARDTYDGRTQRGYRGVELLTTRANRSGLQRYD